MIAHIRLTPLPDFSIGVFYALGAVASLIILMFVSIVLLEALVLYLMKWDTQKVSLRDSFVVNLVTTVLGFFLTTWLNIPHHINLSTFTALRIERNIFWSVTMWLVTWAISVTIEGALLVLTKRQPARKTWLASLVMNIASYIALIVMPLLYQVVF